MYPFSDFSIMPQNEPWNEYFLINLKVQKTRNKLHINYNIKNKKENLRKINSQTTKTSTLGSYPSHTKKREKKRNSKNARARHRRIFKHFLRIRAGGPPALEGRARARARAKYPEKNLFLSWRRDPFWTSKWRYETVHSPLQKHPPRPHRWPILKLEVNIKNLIFNTG